MTLDVRHHNVILIRQNLKSWTLLKKVKWSRYRSGVAQRVGRGIALLFHDCGTRRGEWSAARAGRTLPLGKTRYHFYRRLGGPPGLVWTGRKSRPHGDSIPDCPARGQSLYRLSYPAHAEIYYQHVLTTRNVTQICHKDILTYIYYNQHYAHDWSG